MQEVLLMILSGQGTPARRRRRGAGCPGRTTSTLLGKGPSDFKPLEKIYLGPWLALSPRGSLLVFL